MRKRDYPAIFYRQRDESPLQAAFVAPSSQIAEWARVPTKTTGNIRFFQRAELPNHVSEVQRFFSDHPDNASPTAIVVGFDPHRSRDRISLLGEDGEPLKINSITNDHYEYGKLRLEYPTRDEPEELDGFLEAIEELSGEVREVIVAELTEITGLTEAEFDSLFSILSARMLAGEPSLADENEANWDDEDEDSDREDNSESGDDFAGVPAEIAALTVGLSPSETKLLFGRIEFLARLDPELVRQLPIETLHELYRELVAETKPGMIIDGQHRVLGTKTLGNIPFLVCGLPTASWPELAFQFIVTNRTARRVPESLLINIVGNSLSKSQRSQIESRLRDSGIRVGLIEAVMQVNEDETSPFYQWLAFGLAGESGFLDAAAMRNKVIGLWYERKQPVRFLFDHLCVGKTVTEKTDFWKAEDLWYDYFVTFWTAVRERYDGSDVFSAELEDSNRKVPASRLMTATVLRVFQETVLEHITNFLKTQEQMTGESVAESLVTEQEFYDLVERTVKPLVPEFFTGWALTGFDGSRGARDDLADAITKVIGKEKTVSQLKGGSSPHRLYREP